MRSCFVADTSSVLIQRYIGYFVRQKHNVSVISKGDIRIPGAKCYFIPLPSFLRKMPKKLRRIPENFLYWLFIINKFREIKPEIVNAIYLFPYGIFTIYSFLPKSIPIVMSPWGSDISRFCSKNSPPEIAASTIKNVAEEKSPGMAVLKDL